VDKNDEKDLTNQEQMNIEEMIIGGAPDEPNMPNYASNSQFGGDVNIQEGENNGGMVGMVNGDA
jgi:hypothetical protein